MELNFQQRSTSKPGSSAAGCSISSASTVRLTRSRFLISFARWNPYSLSLSELGGNAVTKQTFIIGAHSAYRRIMFTDEALCSDVGSSLEKIFYYIFLRPKG